jgi:hypothetical protein
MITDARYKENIKHRIAQEPDKTRPIKGAGNAIVGYEMKSIYEEISYYEYKYKIQIDKGNWLMEQWIESPSLCIELQKLMMEGTVL